MCIATKVPSKVTNVLDCGCGRGRWGSFVRTDVNQDSYIVGVDIFPPNLFFCKTYGAYDDLVLADAGSLPFNNESFNMILACEIIEHLSKEDGWVLVKDLERISSGRIIISTPNFDLSQGALCGNIHEIHKTRWSVGDFRKSGFKVKGIGVKFSLKRFLSPLDTVLRFLLFPGWTFPRASRFLCAYKDKRSLC
jgi:SAM-dependent methyltransferase